MNSALYFPEARATLFWAKCVSWSFDNWLVNVGISSSSGAAPRVLASQPLWARTDHSALKTAQRVKIWRKGESENAGQQDQSESFKHFFLLLTAVCADEHSTFHATERHPIAMPAEISSKRGLNN
jgi:hypothetical protein